jgi:hypothetical protein
MFTEPAAANATVFQAQKRKRGQGSFWEPILSDLWMDK